MKTMTLCCTSYVLLAALTVFAEMKPVAMAFSLTVAAIVWALVMWGEKSEPPDVEI